jgi:hypothetical protein
VADDLREGLYQFLLPLLALLDACLDVRLVRTFLATVETVLSFRNRAHGLLLSERGGYLLAVPIRRPPEPNDSPICCARPNGVPT